ncbi:hypothetical protein TRVA0_035S01134 [Trichomonascus vanleenenianus]|uniref:uncharacterized protein n=1 Tax=Trichomonascus vanleenenianus TaxID=2268995 RepID=UPI003ECA9850
MVEDADGLNSYIKVAVRVRPSHIDDESIVLVHGDQIEVINERASAKAFRYDKCYDTSTQQGQIFEQLGHPLLDHAFKGFNNTLFAYGQTGSGKSHTIMGSAKDEGILPRTAKELFRRIEQEKGNGVRYRVEISYLEIYNEKARDLLNPKNKTALKVREHPSLGPYAADLTKHIVGSYPEVQLLIKEGNKTRTVAATNMNASSSRSHAVFTILLTQSKEEMSLTTEKASRISIIDLAGSERAAISGTSGMRLKEGSEINKSLTTLGRVISSLARPKKKEVVAYRDSTLTWLLKDSLGGNSMTTVVATVSPSRKNADQTLSTLRFADSAKRIKNKAIVNEDPNAKIIRELKEELDMLRQKLRKSQDTDENSSESVDADLRDRLMESERLLAEANQTWEDRLKLTQEMQKEREKELEDLGISLENDMVGLHTPRRVPHLVNLSDDPLLTECLVYNIKSGDTIVGGGPNACIRLEGARILDEHCIFRRMDKTVTIAPLNRVASVVINGLEIVDEVEMHSGYRIELGDSHIFRFNNPLENRRGHSRSSSFHTPTNRRSLQDAPLFLSSALYDFANSDPFGPSSPSSLAGSLLFSSPSRIKKNRRLSLVSLPEELHQGFLKERKQTAAKWFRVWKNSRLVQQVHTLCRCIEALKNAQRLVDELDIDFYFQPIILDQLGLEFPRDKRLLEDEVAAGCYEHICVRVIDSKNNTIQILTRGQFEDRLDHLERNVRLSNPVSASEARAVFETNSASYIGFAEIPMAVFDCVHKTLKVELISPYTYTASGAILLSVGSMAVEDIKAVGVQDEMYSLYVSILLHRSTRGQQPEVRHLGFFPLANIQRMPILNYSNEWKLRINVFGTINELFVQKLLSWDEMQEPGQPGQADATESTDCLITTKVLELNEQGAYVATAVVLADDGGQVVNLHQGLQRKLEITFSSPEDIFDQQSLAPGTDRQPTVSIGGVRLLGPEGIISKDDGMSTTIDLAISHRTTVIRATDTGHYTASITCAWDSSILNSPYLDKLTPAKSHVKATITVQLPTIGSLDPIVFQFEIHFTVKSRRYFIPRLFTLIGYVKAAKQAYNLFNLTRRSVAPRTAKDFRVLGLLDAMPSKVTGRWVPRGVSLLREFYCHKERAKVHDQVQIHRVLSETRPVSTVLEPSIPLQSFETTGSVIRLWRLETFSPDNRLRMWDYRYILSREAQEQSSDCGFVVVAQGVVPETRVPPSPAINAVVSLQHSELECVKCTVKVAVPIMEITSSSPVLFLALDMRSWIVEKESASDPLTVRMRYQDLQVIDITFLTPLHHSAFQLAYDKRYLRFVAPPM